MITTSAHTFVLESASQKTYDGASIVCEPVYSELTATFGVTLHVLDTVSTNYIDRGYMSLTVAEVDAETGAGAGETAPWFNALQKAVKTKLLTYTGNASVTFTVV